MNTPEPAWVVTSKEETARANLAEWRASAIRHVRKGFSHMKLAYEGNEVALENICAMSEQFDTLFKDRLEKLDEIARNSRDKAARATEFGVNQGG